MRDRVSTVRPPVRSAVAVPAATVLAFTLVMVMELGILAAPTVIRHGPREQPWVALTFDDGWRVDRCARIVRTLRVKRAPATFFINGAIIDRRPARWRSLLKGFSIANHTLSHKDLTDLAAARIRGQIALNERVIERVLGRPVLRLLRPPYGAYDHEVLRIASSLGYHTILWDTDSGDGRRGATTRGIVRDGSRGDNGAVVLLHCGPAATPKAVGRIIDRYRAHGYRLVDLGRLLDLEPPPTACRVTNERSGDSAPSLQQAGRRAASGDRLFLHGTCLGTTRISKGVEVVGSTDGTGGTPTLDGVGKGTVVTVRAGATVTLRDLTVRAGERGIENYGDLTLDGVIVERNRGKDAGAGIHNAEGATLLLSGSSVVRRNTAVIAGGGILNAGALELQDASSIVRNTVLDEGPDADAQGTDPDRPDATHPQLDRSATDGPGAGILDMGTLIGVVCAPDSGANVRDNVPDDCSDAPGPTPETRVPTIDPGGVILEPLDRPRQPRECPSAEHGCLDEQAATRATSP